MQKLKWATSYRESSPKTFQGKGTSDTSEGKLDSMLARLANGGRLNKFEAERLGDQTLNTSVSTLQSKHDATFSRKREKVLDRFGGSTSVNRYWLEGESQERARRIVRLQQEAA